VLQALRTRSSYCNCSGIWNLVLQESILPMSNMRRIPPVPTQKPRSPEDGYETGRQWLASSDSQRLYSFDISISPTPSFFFSFPNLTTQETHLSRILRGRKRHNGAKKGDIDLQNAEGFTFKSALWNTSEPAIFQFENAEKIELLSPLLISPHSLIHNN